MLSSSCHDGDPFAVSGSKLILMSSRAICVQSHGRFGLSRGGNSAKRAALQNGAAASPGGGPESAAAAPVAPADGTSLDFNTKLLHLAWHPEVNLIAAAASNSLYMYYAR